MENDFLPSYGSNIFVRIGLERHYKLFKLYFSLLEKLKYEKDLLEMTDSTGNVLCLESSWDRKECRRIVRGLLEMKKCKTHVYIFEGGGGGRREEGGVSVPSSGPLAWIVHTATP